MQVNRNIHLCEKNASIYKLSRSKAPKTQQFCHYRHVRNTSGLFLLYNTGVDFRFRNNFANLSSFAKASVPIQSKIPCAHKLKIVCYLLNERQLLKYYTQTEKCMRLPFNEH